jgi:hypothetical protein
LKYSSFERIVIVVSALAIVATVAMSLVAGPVSVPELVGQVLVLAVLAAAVHWGRNGGFIAAAAATITYALLAVPEVAAGHGLQPQTVQLVLVHAVVYAIVGVVGGEVCGRLKYQLAGIDGTSALDDDTRLYGESVVHGLASGGLARFHRYGTPFSVVELHLSPGLFAELRPVKRRAILRRVANHVRNDVRMVDDIGRLQDGRFVVLLPSTPVAGAEVVADRLRKGICDQLSALDDSITARVYATDRDPEELERFYCALQPAPGTPVAGFDQDAA